MQLLDAKQDRQQTRNWKESNSSTAFPGLWIGTAFPQVIFKEKVFPFV